MYRKSYARSRKPASTYSGKQKRWYVDASIPKSVPLIGGSSFRAGSGNISKRSLTTLIRQTQENKQKIVIGGANPLTLHNTIYTYNAFGNLPIGTGANSRLSSSVFIKDFSMSLTFDNVSATSLTTDVFYRVLVLNTDSQVLSGLDTFASGIGVSHIFVQGSTLLLNSHTDVQRCTVLHDSTVKLSPTLSTGTVAQTHMVNCCKNKSIKYSSPTSNYIFGKNTYVVVIPYIINGATGSTITGGFKFETLINFTDA